MKNLILGILFLFLGCDKHIDGIKKENTYKLQFNTTKSDRTVGFIVVDQYNKILVSIPKNESNTYSVILKLRDESVIGIKEVFNNDTSKPLIKLLPK